MAGAERWVVTGAGGMLAADLAVVLAGRDARFLTRADLDIRDADAVRDAVSDADVVINAAAYTRVDDAESHEAEAFAVNATGAGNVAAAVALGGGRLVQISTDYVFDGTASEPYPENAPLAPLGAYGRSKAAGERAVRTALPGGAYVVRTAWLYGAGGPNFARTMLRRAAEHETVNVVSDQIGQPTWTRDLATAIRALVDAGAPPGVYHGTSGGRASWFDFARAIFETSGLDPDRVRPVTSAEFVRPAPRPAFSVLGHDGWARAGLDPIRPWRAAVEAAAATGALGVA